MSLNEIKKQIGSISKTAQITHAMQLISTTKYNRIVNQAKNYSLYSDKVREMVMELVESVGSLQTVLDDTTSEIGSIDFHDLVIDRPIKQIGVLVITSDQGLAGSYNSSLLKQLTTKLAPYNKEQVTIMAVGSPAIRYAEREGYHVSYKRTHLSSYPSFTEVQTLIRESVKQFRDGEFDQLFLCYNHAETVLSVKFTYHQLLPLDAETFVQEEIPHGEQPAELLFEPTVGEVLNQILPLYVETQIYGAIIDAKAAEYSSRMQAMRQATDNAHELIDNLQQRYHQERQKRITNEIIEIINGANAQE